MTRNGGGSPSRCFPVRCDGRRHSHSLRQRCCQTSSPLFPRPVQISLLASQERRAKGRISSVSPFSGRHPSRSMGHILERRGSQLGSCYQDNRSGQVSEYIKNESSLWAIPVFVPSKLIHVIASFFFFFNSVSNILY